MFGRQLFCYTQKHVALILLNATAAEVNANSVFQLHSIHLSVMGYSRLESILENIL
jgi:hypothetical protein